MYTVNLKKGWGKVGVRWNKMDEGGDSEKSTPPLGSLVVLGSTEATERAIERIMGHQSNPTITTRGYENNIFQDQYIERIYSHITDLALERRGASQKLRQAFIDNTITSAQVKQFFDRYKNTLQEYIFYTFEVWNFHIPETYRTRINEHINTRKLPDDQPTIQSITVREDLIGINEITAPTKPLANIGDFNIHEFPGDIKFITVCTRVDRTTHWVKDWQVPILKEAGRAISATIETPILQTFTKDTFPAELQRNDVLMEVLKRGALYELEKAGFTGNLGEIDTNIDYKGKSLECIAAQLEGDPTYSKRIYPIAQALIAEGLLDPASRSDVVKHAKQAISQKEVIRIDGNTPFRVIQAIFDDEQTRTSIFEEEKILLKETSNAIEKIRGWATLAASANTPEQRQEAYALVMTDIDTNFFSMAENVPIAAAILANEEQKRVIYALASESQHSRYWKIKWGNIVAMAICGLEGDERSQIFGFAKEELAKEKPHISDKFALVVMALTAQTPEEKIRAWNIIEIYADTRNGYNHIMNAWANIALGILGSNENERDLAIKSVAAVIEYSR